MRRSILFLLAVTLVAAAHGARAQDKGTLEPEALPPLENPKDAKTPAKELFGRKPKPAALPARVIGAYWKGCLAGGVALPINGPTWQVMRLSRNRNWGHPDLIAYMERLGARAKAAGWPGLLVGDMAQPRGGPMITGHASHQVGLDADIWLTPMPNRELTRQERAEMSAIQMVAADRRDVDPKVWTHGQMAVIKAAAEDPRVERVFVNPAIKKALCREAGSDRAWLSKVRPIAGHDYHFHVRISCPQGNHDCVVQDPVPHGDGCGKPVEEALEKLLRPVPPPKHPIKPKPPLVMADLPAACRQVLSAP